MGPALAEVGGFPHRRSEPLVAAAGPDRAVSHPRVADRVVDRPGLAIRAADIPAPAGAVAFDNERALLRSDQDQDPHRHSGLLRSCCVSGFIKLISTCRPSVRSEEHTSELQSLMRIKYAAFCLNKKHT